VREDGDDDGDMTEAGTTDAREGPALVVGVGASAGGLDACQQLLAKVPPRSGLAFIVVLHLDPERDSHLAEVLTGRDGLPVTQVTRAQRIEPDHVYVIAPNTSLEIVDGELRPGRLPERNAARRAIDVLFSSLARACGEDAAAVVLSGLGSDGAEGLRDIKAAGGLCIAQAPETAQHDGMPQAAIATGIIDAILAPEAIVERLLTRARGPRPHVAPPPRSTDAEPDTDASGFAEILGLLTTQHGFDTRNYKRGTLMRRAERRRGLAHFSSWPDYANFLAGHPEELEALYEDILVGVTRFFRDPEQWEELEAEVIPRLLDERDHAGAVRAWSVGCATGEEAYSLAMVLLEQLEGRGEQEKLQVFATDLSQNAIAHARRGVYPASVADDVSQARLARFFSKRGDSYQIKQNIRDVVTLARHDLLSEPPFSRLDLVCCRNLFIYLEPHAQHEALRRLHFALRSRGVLWLGSSESISRHTELFTTISAKSRIYRKSQVRPAGEAATRPWSARIPYPGPFVSSVAGRTLAPASLRSSDRLTRSLEEHILQRYTRACVVINEAGNVLHLFGPTSDYIVPPTGEVRLDLLAWVRQSALYAKLRPALARALEQHAPVKLTGVPLQRGDESVRVEVTIDPIFAVAEGLFIVSFADEPEAPSADSGVTVVTATDDPLASRLAKQLQEAQAELQVTMEELDHTNEEYRASYEELVSLNEELQSSNEELETTKEETQSINEELLTVNRELEERNEKLRLVNADLENLLALTTIPIVFLDRQLQIRRFTPAAERVMWLVAADLGRPAQHIQRRVDDEDMLRDAAKVLEDLTPREAEVRAEGGRWYLRRIVPFRTEDRIEGVCMSFYDITSEKLATSQSEEARHYVELILEFSRLPLLVLDQNLVVVSANDVFRETFVSAEPELAGRPFDEIGDGEWSTPAIRELLERVRRERVAVERFELEVELDDGGVRHLRLNAAPLERPQRTPLLLLSIEDVTVLREAQDSAAKRMKLEDEHRRKDEFLAVLGHELRNPLAALVNGISLLGQVSREPARIERIQPMLARQTRRMTVMLDQLLDISRVSSGKIELDEQTVDLVEVANAAVEAVQPMITASRHQLTLSLPPSGSLFVRGDLVRLIQVVENLLTNAIKYTEDGGTIRLAIDANEDSARIRVGDTGLGIEPELLEHIFEAFTQGTQSLDRAQGGLGLGLALVRLLVDMHGGRVEAFSAGPGQGSEFVVHLPRLTPATAGPAGPSPPALTLDTDAPRRVLVVDDELDLALTLAELLRTQGHEVEVAHDGQAALDCASSFAPDVVLLDLGLPGMNGYELARRLRERLGAAPRLVAVSGYPRDDRRTREAGFDDHVIKPPTPEQLAAVLAAPLRFADDRRE
jgi:two-component system CheB/CheR fusion protein